MNLRRGRLDDEVDVAINLVSFIDVLLCLVIFFMVSTTFVNKANIALSLPRSGVEPQNIQQTAKVEVTINAKGQTFINANPVPPGTPGVLRRALKEATHGRKDPSIIISADRRTTHQSVIDVLDASRQLGLAKVGFVTDHVEEQSSASVAP